MLPQPWAILRVSQGEIDEGGVVAFKVANVVSLLAGTQLHSKNFAALMDEGTDGISELNLASLTRLGFIEQFKDNRAKDVACSHSKVAGGFTNTGLFDDVSQGEHIP